MTNISTLNLERYNIPALAHIENYGVIITSNTSHEPWPLDRQWNGLVVFDLNTWLPVKKQYIPAGTYKNILLTGRKNMDAMGLVVPEQVKL